MYEDNEEDGEFEFVEIKKIIEEHQTKMADMTSACAFISEQMARRQVSFAHRLLDEGIIDCRDYRMIFRYQEALDKDRPTGLQIMAKGLEFVDLIEGERIYSEYGVPVGEEYDLQVLAIIGEVEKACAEYKRRSPSVQIQEALKSAGGGKA